MPNVVAIDGPAGSGKSTLARALARQLGLPYVNTGLMYRALAAQALAAGIDPEDSAALTALAAQMDFSLGGARPAGLLVDGRSPSRRLRSGRVEELVSRVSRHPSVRDVMRKRQRELGASGAVMEGRDIAAEVFPDAPMKIFLSAAPDVRAERRLREEGGSAGAARAVHLRDALDERTTPLRPAPGAIVLDSSSLTRDQVLRQALAIVAEEREKLVAGFVAGSDVEAAGGEPVVAVVGRQNVGKSTLINRLAGRTIAISHETPGVTRDRVEVAARWRGRTLRLVDTGGYTARARGIDETVAAQAGRAVALADLILLVVDAITGLQEEDALLARKLRRATTPVLVVANKVDGESQEPGASAFHALGLGEPVAVSALHGRGSGDLLDRVVDLTGGRGRPVVEADARFALVGRPNVGKSSLFNKLVREERAVVHDLPGTTRDAVDSLVAVEGRRLRFVDTAGFRRAIKTRDVEYYGLVRAVRAIDSSDVAVLVVDASEGLTSEDKHLAARVAESGRGLAVALNKWDLVPSGERAALFRDLGRQLRLFPGTPVVRTSALTGMGVSRMVRVLLGVHEKWAKRVPTTEVNRVLRAATEAHPPPRGTPRVRYATQVSAGPPSFVLFGSADPGAAYRRYLENRLRDAFGFEGVPIRMRFRPNRRARGGAPWRRGSER